MTWPIFPPMLKRAFDILLAAAALAAFFPVGLLIALICRCTGDGDVFFRQCRIGRERVPFDMLKFASMRTVPPAADGSVALTVRGDPRVHPWGRVLRMTKLNEVPQLLNVLKGDMSIVGPRPMLPGELSMLPDDVVQRLHQVAPGVTGLGSLVFRDEEDILSASPKGVAACYREDIAPLKADLELWYVERASLPLDLRIMLLTAWLILRPRSRAYARLLGPAWCDFQVRLEALHRSAPAGAPG